jgi:hypothetical protein
VHTTHVFKVPMAERRKDDTQWLLYC